MSERAAGDFAGLTCGNCIFAKGRHADPELEAIAAGAGHPVARMRCHRYPDPQPVRDEHWCGEHPMIAEKRRSELAEAVAWAVSSMLAARGLRDKPARKDA